MPLESILGIIVKIYVKYLSDHVEKDQFFLIIFIIIIPCIIVSFFTWYMTLRYKNKQIAKIIVETQEKRFKVLYDFHDCRRKYTDNLAILNLGIKTLTDSLNKGSNKKELIEKRKDLIDFFSNVTYLSFIEYMEGSEIQYTYSVSKKKAFINNEVYGFINLVSELKKIINNTALIRLLEVDEYKITHNMFEDIIDYIKQSYKFYDIYNYFKMRKIVKKIKEVSL